MTLQTLDTPQAVAAMPRARRAAPAAVDTDPILRHATPMLGRFACTGHGWTHYIEQGEGPPIVLLHGLGSLGQEIVAPFAEGAPGRLIAVDRPGYGWSSPLPANAAGPDGQAAWFASFLDAIGVERALVVAHSIGAATALAFATRHPERVSGLLLLAPYCRPSRPGLVPLIRASVMPIVGPAARWLIQRGAALFGRGKLKAMFAPGTVPATLHDFPFSHAARPSAMVAMARELSAYNAAMMPICFRLRELAMPAAIVAGADDTVAEFDRHASWLGRRLPVQQTIRLGGVGHLPHHSAPEVALAALRSLQRKAGW